ncbi:hypothetical protein AALP_AA3G060200 [Arabis alpina]|uniref:ADP-ribosyl cyclase/cyclic ADP-ribose hydrolase n=1 Tax=Arabis alpina TaxID=50452 RepID=A0A087H7C2_ARAAL|nr:hypothetical protein AALP_AA3G060200 [Arabis alpina]
MASSLSRNWTYCVFTSFHGPDVRKTFLSHLRKQFSCNGISMFDDQGIERGQTIAPALTQAIRESRISIVVLSKKYASSSWCLDELVEIFKCKEELGQIVMTVFYGVDPSDVRKQTGDFGTVFNETCARKTEEERQKWSQALTDAGNIAGEHFLNWDNECKMIEKIASDVSNKLNTTISKDFKDMVGIEVHLEKLLSLLQLNYEDGAMIVGITGPAGIGKTTIARALYSRLSSSFHLSCFMENVSGSYNRGLDDHGLKLSLQEQLLSKILNQNCMRIYHLGAIRERLCNQKVLIILDDVDDLEQLEALADETSWFGPGSKIIITTKDQEVLEQHEINNTYHVDFPTKEEARHILCRYAFRRSLAPDEFEKLVERVTELCSNLPLGLRVIGSALRGKREGDWECILYRLENSLDRKIERVLRVGYDNLHKDDQLLFLLIAFFFNYQGEDHVKTMLADSNLDVGLGFGLKTLAYRSLIQISPEGKIVMHKLLQQVGREALQRQDQGKCQILTENNYIRHALENDFGSGNVMGISFDISTLKSDVNISPVAFKRICNLRFLNIYKTRICHLQFLNKTSFDKENRVHVPDDMNFPSSLRLLRWEEYPGKCLPQTFRPEYLVELNLQNNELEKLWEGIQPLTNLKKMNLVQSLYLKELPDLSNATNLETLDMKRCFSLVEIPSSFGNLQKLERLDMEFCLKLQVVPTDFNLASLESVNMARCFQLRKFPDIFGNITKLSITDTMLQDLAESVRLWSRIQSLIVRGSGNTPPYAVEMGGPDIEKIPDCIKDLPGLKDLSIYSCPKLASLPELPISLRNLTVSDCESLETLMSFPYNSHIKSLHFSNCFKLGHEARRVITQQSSEAWLPGRNVPAEFDQRAIGNSLTIPSGSNKYMICVVVSPKQNTVEWANFWRRRCNGFHIEEQALIFAYLLIRVQGIPGEQIIKAIDVIQTDHQFISQIRFVDKLQIDQSLVFSTTSKDIDIIECGFQSFTDKTNRKHKWEERSLWHQDMEQQCIR